MNVKDELSIEQLELLTDKLIVWALVGSESNLTVNVDDKPSFIDKLDDEITISPNLVSGTDPDNTKISPALILLILTLPDDLLALFTIDWTSVYVV